jgi:hypothetical protein
VALVITDVSEEIDGKVGRFIDAWMECCLVIYIYIYVCIYIYIYIYRWMDRDMAGWIDR